MRSEILLFAFTIAMGGCGYVGEPLPPSLKIPGRVSDLAVRQQGQNLIVTFTIPQLTTDGVVLHSVQAIDLRAGPGPTGGWNMAEWVNKASHLEAAADKPGPVRVEVPAANWVNRGEIIFGVRASGPTGRFSEWSNLATLRVIPPIATPTNLKAEAVPEGVLLTWSDAGAPPGITFHVFRQAEKEEKPTLLADVKEPRYVDTSTTYGVAYTYSVQAAVQAGESNAASEIASPVAIKPEDRFPPAVPSGLAGAAGTQGIQLTWDPNSEPDLKGYRVYRAAPGEDFKMLADNVTTPNYVDRAIEAGKQYRYAVTSVDQLGNESAKSAPVTVQAMPLGSGAREHANVGQGPRSARVPLAPLAPQRAGPGVRPT